MTINWTPIFEGIEHAQSSFSSPPRANSVNWLRIDLENENVSFLTTPKNDSCGLDTIGMRIDEFITNHPGVCVAVNANFCYANFDCKTPPPDSVCTQFQIPDLPYQLIGYSVSQGHVVSGPTSKPQDAGAISLLITRDNKVSFLTAPNSPHETPWSAVSGGPNPTSLAPPPVSRHSGCLFLVEEGENKATDQTAGIAARTALGVTADGLYLILLTVDGIESSGTQGYGATFNDMAKLLISAGVQTGFALDGGGSTVMARSSPIGPPELLNKPHGCETEDVIDRYLGNYLGVISVALSQS